MAVYPTMPEGGDVSPDVSLPGRDVPSGMEGVAEHLSVVAERLQHSALGAAKIEGQNQAVADAQSGHITAQSDFTAFGQSYNDIAKQALGEQRRAAMAEGMGAAYANNPDNPAALDKALVDVRAGLAGTPFKELDLQLDGDFALRRATLMSQAQAGYHRQMIEAQAGNYQSAYETGAEGLDQAAASATFDQDGATRIAAGHQAFVKSLAQYGPPVAFKVGDVDVPADPSRPGVISAAQIAAHAGAALGEAKRTWITNAQLALSDPAAQAKFADDLRERYIKGDPIFAGLDGSQAETLFNRLDTQAAKASTDQRADRQSHAQAAEHQIEALQWGDNVDTSQLLADAHASGDAGLVAKAEFFAQAAPELKGVLKTVVRRQLGLDPEPGALAGQPLDASGAPIGGTVGLGGGSGAAPRPIGAPLVGDNAVADQVRGYAKQAGASPAEQESLVKFGVAESSLDPARDNGASRGLFQFRDPTWTDMGGGDIRSVRDQTVNALKLMRQDKAYLTGHLPAPPTEGQLYLAHQQGAGGALALLTAPTGESAIAALTPVYEAKHPGHGAEIAREAVMRNGGVADVTARQFADHWTGRFDGAASANPNAWTPPAGVAQGTPAYYAWVSGKEGFSSNPIQFAQAHQLASVPPIIPQAGFATDAAQVGNWTAGMRQRQAIGTELQRTYGVPLRLLTDGERDDLKSYLQQNPAAIVTLAQRATAAIGAGGAQNLMRELGQGGDIGTVIHIGDLATRGNGVIARAAAEGIALKAAGAKDIPFVAGAPNFDQAQAAIAPAFLYAPSVMVAARNTAELARLSDGQKGIVHSPNYYLQSALGATNDGQGHIFGGAAQVNGQPTVIPPWLRQDQAEDALRAVGDSWEAHGRGGPVYANGQPMRGRDVGRLRLIMRPNGNYWLADPKSGQLARFANGHPVEWNADNDRNFLAGRLPGGVRR